MTRILIVEDQPICRLGIRMTLGTIDMPCELIGEAATVEQAIAFLEERGNEVDLILLDYALPDGNGADVIDAAKRLCPNAKIVMLSGEAGGAIVQQLMDKGISGFMNKNINTDEMIAMLASVMRGNDFVGENPMLLQPDVQADFDTLQTLTRREMEIITLCAAGMSAKQIADELSINPHSVENHKDSIFKKIGVKSTSELILYAFRVGLIS